MLTRPLFWVWVVCFNGGTGTIDGVVDYGVKCFIYYMPLIILVIGI